MDKVLNLLRSKEEYISGEEMSKVLEVTRASIWKNINKLKQQGYTIESSTKKGYRLVNVPNIITAAEVLESMTTKILGKEIKYYPEIGSTNEAAKMLAREGASEGMLVIADKQTAGKGRLGRTWESPSGTGIWMSIVLRPPIMPMEASGLTLIAGLSMCEAIEQVTGLVCQIKWPNDLIINGKKVCGILTEMSAEPERIKYVIIGIGINVNHKNFSEELPYASSLAIEGGKEYERKDIIKAFLQRFEKDYASYIEKGRLNSFLDRYRTRCATLYKTVKVLTHSSEYEAYAKDIAEDGSLIITDEEGKDKIVFAGEVSVRGLYSYID